MLFLKVLLDYQKLLKTACPNFRVTSVGCQLCIPWLTPHSERAIQKELSGKVVLVRFELVHPEVRVFLLGWCCLALPFNQAQSNFCSSYRFRSAKTFLIYFVFAYRFRTPQIEAWLAQKKTILISVSEYRSHSLLSVVLDFFWFFCF